MAKPHIRLRRRYRDIAPPLPWECFDPSEHPSVRLVGRGKTPRAALEKYTEKVVHHGLVGARTRAKKSAFRRFFGL